MDIKRGHLFAIIAALVAAPFVIAVVLAQVSTDTAPSRTVSVPDLELDPMSGRIAFVSDRDGDKEIYVMNADGSGLSQLTDNDYADGAPSWSPDGKRIAFASSRDKDYHSDDVYVMNADGSGVEQVTDGCTIQDPAWSPNGDRIAYVSMGHGDKYLTSPEGGDPERLTGDATYCAEFYWADFDGDGSIEAHIVNADGSEEILPEESWFSLYQWDGTEWFPTWSPDGGRIAFISGRDGDISYVDIYVIDVADDEIKRLAKTDGWDHDPDWSPDGGRIAFGLDGDIFVMNYDGTNMVQLMDDEYLNFTPAWSPDGGHIAFSSDRDGEVGIYVMNADGSGIERLADGHSPAWSPVLD